MIRSYDVLCGTGKSVIQTRSVVTSVPEGPQGHGALKMN